MADVCLIDRTDSMIAVVTLNRPQVRNALSVELIERLTEAVRVCGADGRCRVLMLRGAGTVFCAGLDLQEASDPAFAHQSALSLAQLYVALCECPLITLASAQGAAVGGGAGLLAACDLVIASDDLKIGFPEVHRGLVAALVTCMVRRQLGERVVRELVLLGQTIPASRALALGLINRITSATRLTDESMELARQACKGAPGAIARTKRLLDDLSPRPIAQDLHRALQYHLEARDSPEAAEGVSAFLERREPRWGDRPNGS